ncbi:MAG TPA: hypothetical protein VKF17_00070 [Isosphaeraceae bacterium]|nr:hypothetical protein [Isosphaeraceae bacterium]
MTTVTAGRREARTGLESPVQQPAPSARRNPALFRLLKVLEELLRTDLGGTPPPDAPCDGFDGREEGDDHVYYFFNLPHYDGSDIDINVHGQTMIVLVEKRHQDN